MWVRFTADHDFSPAARKGLFTLAYKVGTVANVTRECAEQALRLGRAVRTAAPRKGERDGARRG
ncbi:hypothetical protein [Kumtagia ephedrae]|jgi:hypothetical protein|uniref:Uncharacterized protein n=1 Tax=Kumtagia ephedrae TaxID=2116701 RepID=A0A2P7SPW2_9HYPH|nr:hypothetical protein [Mesorhizobium ephedrae]PSJ64503.1 hypothetical protein C7I84_06045 [Mesorhizobium ephedrae]